MKVFFQPMIMVIMSLILVNIKLKCQIIDYPNPAFYLLSKKYKNDSIRLTYIEFLKSNIQYHETHDYLWVDSMNNIVPFNELDYPDFSTSVLKFNIIKKNHGKLKPIPRKYSDSTTISSTLIEQSINHATKYAGIYNEEIIKEYLLPYRTLNEPTQAWHDKYAHQFKIFHNPENIGKTISNIIDNIKQWFICTYGIEKKTEPIPYLGSLQLLHRKKGGCEDAANLMTFALRSLGIPCAIDVIPYWGTTSGGHVLNTAFDFDGKPIHFDALIESDSLYEMVREPAKVFRMTYSNNKSSLPNLISYYEIPDYGLLKSYNYIDVTHEYFKTKEISYEMPDSLDTSVVYASVFNGGKWKPVWYSTSKNKIIFNNMVPGVVYLPQIFKNGKLSTIGYPKAITKDTIIEFKPSNEVHTINVKELAGYLSFRTGKVYTLYYYDKKWIKVQRKIPNDGTKRLIFHKVPKNALLLLKPEDSKGKERPFYYSDDGIRYWW